MSSVNMVILVGNLAADPEIKATNQGGRIARMRLITSEAYKDKDGNRKENSHGHNIVVFNERLVDVIEAYGRKGQKIAITGKLENRTWTDSDEVKHYATEVVLPRYGGEFKMLSSANEGGEDRGGNDRGGNDRGSDRSSNARGRDDNRGGGSGNSRGGSDNRGRDDDRNSSRDSGGNRGSYDNRGGGGRNDDLDDDVPF